MPHRPIITLTTDFGINDHFVGTMKGVILSIAPEAEIVDISHAVQAFDVLDGALAISQSYSYFPNTTVHVVVVDPGVGTERRPILASSDGYHFVAPDNGVLSLVYAKEERIRVRHITSEHYFRQPVSNTFHARDVFAPVAGYLAKLVDSDKFGDEIEETGPGDIDLHTGSGNITARGIQGGFRGEAGSGDITAEGTQSGTWEIRSGSGNVRVRLGSNAAFDADLATSSGTIDVGSPIEMTVQGRVEEARKKIHGKVRGGGPLLSVRTGSGDIEIQ